MTSAILGHRVLLRFLSVGVVATLVHVSVALAADRFVGLAPLSSNTAGFLAALTVSYLGHYTWTFSVSTAHERHLPKFIVVAVLSYLLSSTVVFVGSAVAGGSFPATIIVTAVLVPPLTFALSKYWAFSREAAAHEDDRYLYLMPIVLVAWTALLQYGGDLNHDTSWYLIATDRWLSGATLYQDIMEINPPLSFYVTAIAVYLSRLTGIDSTTTFTLLVLAMTFAATLWSTAIVRRLERSEPLGQRMLGTLLVLSVTIVTLDDFGQREHVMLILSLPLMTYLVGRPRLSIISVPEQVGMVTLACLGIALKPHFALPLLFLLLPTLALPTWRQRISAWIPFFVLGLLGSAYVVFVSVFHPQYMKDMVPLAFDAYEYSDATTADLLVAVLPFTAALIAIVSLQRSSPINFRILVNAVVCVAAAAISHVVQGKGWHYQALPFYSYITAYLGWQLLVQSETRQLSRAMSTILTVCVVAPLVAAPLIRGPYDNSLSRQFTAIAVDKPELESVIVLSSNVSAAFPFINQSELIWSSRYPAMWIIPGPHNRWYSSACEQKPSENCSQIEEHLEQARTSIVDDFVAGDPDMVIVDDRGNKDYIDDPNFDYIDFLSADARFTSLWSRYRKTKELDDYTIWLRDPESTRDDARPSTPTHHGLRLEDASMR